MSLKLLKPPTPFVQTSVSPAEYWDTTPQIRLDGLFHYLKAHIPYYEAHTPGQNAPEWHQLPIADKTLFETNFEQLNRLKLSRKQIFEHQNTPPQPHDEFCIGKARFGISERTTGTPFIWVSTDQERDQEAGYLLGKILNRSFWGRYRIANFYPYYKPLLERIQSGRIKVQSFSLDTPQDVLFGQLKAFSPSVIIGSPSLLRTLAQHMARGFFVIYPEKIIAVGEVLEDTDRDFIGRQFNLPVHQFYQAVEGFLGSTCEYGTLHLHTDIFHFEPVWKNESRSHFTPLVTHLDRRVQPIIRYQIGDILKPKRTLCPCGDQSPALAGIEGREEDLIYFYSETQHYCQLFMPSQSRKAIRQASSAIRRFQV